MKDKTIICNPGSIEKLTWGEINDTKGFIWAEVDKDNTSTEFIGLQCREMETTELILTKQDVDLDDKIRNHIGRFVNPKKIFKTSLQGSITWDQYNQLKLDELYSLFRDSFFDITIDRKKLEVSEIDKVFLKETENPADSFAKRMDITISRSNNESEKKFLEEVRKMGLEYLDRAAR
jgi:DNA repair exonuclease SbcCD nuclease subunit